MARCISTERKWELRGLPGVAAAVALSMATAAAAAAAAAAGVDVKSLATPRRPGWVPPKTNYRRARRPSSAVVIRRNKATAAAEAAVVPSLDRATCRRHDVQGAAKETVSGSFPPNSAPVNLRTVRCYRNSINLILKI